ncbi:Myotubularin [Phytophthora megakarya]|uniref:Myotubularin n=1 Tax=Phytophthora megakarya TaxID=4795 RepID=A0A225WIZ8_9STRA|nr:Myotubularin [Phytophthora megakarya]
MLQVSRRGVVFTSFVSDSMYLVMESPAGALYMGETVHFKVHALCDQSLGVSGVTGKKVAKEDDVMHGTLFLTSYRLLFRSFHHHEEELVEVHLSNIAELAEFRVNGKLGPMSQLEVSCKNFELVKFNFPGEAVSGDVYVKINQMLMDKLQPAAYVYTRLPNSSGWTAYDPQAEFTRLGFKTPKNGAQVGGFRITHVNSNYKMSPTYPSSFIVPASMTDGELKKISFFRARGRVPVVTYRYKNDAVVARCAQPLVGLRRKRCASDEAYMIALRRECKGPLLFIDCRSQTSAYGNIALGGGFEVLDYYKDTNIMFMAIENIHSMRDSIRKLFDLIKNEIRGNERPNWLSCLESTRWLEHVRSVLVSCSICVAKLVEGTSLVIHCSDGWDRTAQLTALVKLCADPFYRTIKGFQVLVEQEWCAFGHQFRARSGHTDTQAAYWEDDSTSPVFMQFVDAVWQLMRQFPCSFEFSERYLIALLDEVYSKRTDFRNPFFMVPLSGEGSMDKSPTVLQCKWHTSSLAIWSSFYLRSLESNDSRDAWAKELQVTQRELQDQLSAAHQQLHTQEKQNSDLQNELDQLRRERAQLARLLEGEVYSDTLNGLLVHEEDDDEDGVLLSVTPVGESRTTLEMPCSDSGASTPSQNKIYSTTGVGCFLGGSMSQDFEILQTYFDSTRQETEMFAPTRRTVEEVVR